MNKTVLITGADHGLGMSLSKVFLNNGFTVFAGVYKPEADSGINCLKGRDNLHLVGMDITSLNSVREAARFVGGFTQSIDILINNAGVLAQDEAVFADTSIFGGLDFDSVTDVIDVNAIGALRVASVFSQFLLKGTDRLLVNISSEAGSVSSCERDKWYAYCMSKAALNMAGAIMHNELKKHGGRVLQIDPGYMQTYMHGKKNDKATYSPDFSAENIYGQIMRADAHNPDKVVFINLFGEKLNW